MTELPTTASLRAIVADKLRSSPGDWRIFRSRIPRRILDREAYEAAVLAHFNVTRRWLDQRNVVLASAHGLQVLTALASHDAGFITSARWNAYLEARTAGAWLDIAEGAAPLEASAAAAA